MKVTKVEKELKWQENIEKAKGILGKRNLNQMEVALLALEVCEISWGGSKLKDNSKFTLTNFAAELGMRAKTLSHWVAVRVSVYDKLPKSVSAKATYTPMCNTATRVNRESTKQEVLEAYEKIVNISSMDQTMSKYLASLKSVHYNFAIRNAAFHTSDKILEEYLFYTSKIQYLIKKEKPEIGAKDNRVASESSKTVVSAAAALLGRGDRERGRDTIKDESGMLIRITPKDRDVIAYLRKQSGRWVSPTEIGMKAHGLNSNSASAWAYRTLNKLLGTKLIERSNKGHYRWVGK